MRIIHQAFRRSAETGYDADDLVENAAFDKTVSISFGEWITITNPLEDAGVEVANTNGDVVTLLEISRHLEWLTQIAGSMRRG